jgi:alanyl-tRNA synthetase
MQGVHSNYDIDLFRALIEAAARHTGTSDRAASSLRVIADHIRASSFLIADGVLPSNEGRGYVLRRILRRAVRYGQQFLRAKPGFFSGLVPTVVEHFSHAFPELREKAAFVQDILRDEEESFSRTLQKGIKTFNARAAEIRAAGGAVLPGADAFFLYDSMGFPLDLTQIMAGEQGMRVDNEGFAAAMAAQKARSGAGGACFLARLLSRAAAAAAVAGGEGVKLCRLHLDAQGAVALQLLAQIGAFVIEGV